jgi:hypothetical protein
MLLCRTDAGKLYLAIDKILQGDAGYFSSVDVNLHTLFELRHLVEPPGIQMAGVLCGDNYRFVPVSGDQVDFFVLDHWHMLVPFG